MKTFYIKYHFVHEDDARNNFESVADYEARDIDHALELFYRGHMPGQDGVGSFVDGVEEGQPA